MRMAPPHTCATLTPGGVFTLQTQVMDPMMPINTNEAFVENLREYPGEKAPRKKKEWQSVQGGSILTICKLHPAMRPPMVRPEDDNEVCSTVSDFTMT